MALFFFLNLCIFFEQEKKIFAGESNDDLMRRWAGFNHGLA